MAGSFQGFGFGDLLLRVLGFGGVLPKPKEPKALRLSRVRHVGCRIRTSPPTLNDTLCLRLRDQEWV